MIAYLLDTLVELGIEDIVAVVGYQAEKVAAALKDHPVRFVVQEPQLGTGHAVQVGMTAVPPGVKDVLVLCGDVPLIPGAGIKELYQVHRQTRLGVALGFGVHYVFVWLLAGLVDGALPAASLWPALFGLGVGMTLLLGFGLPPVLQLARVPPLRVIRRDVGALKPASLAVLAAGTAGFVALLMAVSSDLKLGFIAVGGFAAAVALFALMSWGAVGLLRRAVPESRAPRWLVLATRQIAARPAFAVLQVSALSVGLLALVLLVLLRTDLIASWRQATPPDAPNRFVINIQPEQGEAFQQRLKGAGIQRYDWYPMIRGRLVAINGKSVRPVDMAEERAKRLVDREFNLSRKRGSVILEPPSVSSLLSPLFLSRRLSSGENRRGTVL